MTAPALLILALTAAALAPPAHAAPEDLVGSWEFSDSVEDGNIVQRLTFETDGTLAYTTRAEIAVVEEESGDDSDEFALGGLLDGDFVIVASGSGRWTATETSLTLSVTELETTINGQTIEEFLEAIARQLARTLADTLGIDEAEYAAFEEGVVESFLTEMDAASFEEEFVDAFQEPFDYAVTADVLTLTDTEGEPSQWLRVGVSSAVAPISWGTVKRSARHRP